MRWLDDYRGEMRVTIDDRQAEGLLSGDPDVLATEPELGRFLSSMAPLASTRVIRREMGIDLASVALRPPGRGTAVRKASTLAIAGAMLIALAGVAMAADRSAPGDALYPLDRAAELVGLGRGGVDERLREVDVLTRRGDSEGVEDLIEDISESAVGADAGVARHIELAATKENQQAARAQLGVAEKKAFIEENQGNGVGLDGKDLGQGVAELAPSEPGSGEPSPAGSSSGDEATPPGQA